MPATYEPIATTTVANSTTTSVTFSSITSAYTDLRIVLCYGAVTSMYLGLRFNGDTATNYSSTRIITNGTTPATSSQSSASYMAVEPNYSPSSTIPALATIDVFSYAGSTYKTSLTTGSSDLAGSGGLSRRVGLWSSTSAITSVTLFDVSSSSNYFTSGSVITLYGILKA
jgi:hypothetical protein